jgi:phage minor structural protein
LKRGDELIVVKDTNVNDIGILENAFDTPTERNVNEVWQFSFSLPLNDIKNELCSHLNYIEAIGDSRRNYGLYRIMPTETVKNASNESITYSCEHVISTLLDDVMDGYFQYSGYSTSQVIQNILNLQETERWVLGECDFNYFYEYSFENENGLLAPILSIPIAFNMPYEFTYDTTVYPWVLNLKAVSDDVKSEIRWGKDMLDFNNISDPTDIVNYLIPKGFGEGVNQLTIERVNSGQKYLKDDASITKWGKRSYIWIDKSMEDATTLKAKAQALLNQWKEPKISFSVNGADLSILPEYAHERRMLNTVTRIIVEDKEYSARIVGEKISDLSKEYEVSYQINNKISSIATTQAELERKQQVNEAYSQGATNMYNFTYQDNCDNLIPAYIPFIIDNDVVNVNTCELTFRTKKFRGDFGIIETENQSISTDSTTVSGTPSSHSHGITIPGHTHFAKIGIVEYEVNITSVTIKVDGNTVDFTGTSADRLNIVSYLSKDTDGKVARGRHEIEIYPNMAARVEADIILRVFIQSRLGGVY